MTAVFVVTHMPIVGGPIKILGVYASAEDASAAIDRAKPALGAEDLYWIDEYTLGQDDWPTWGSPGA